MLKNQSIIDKMSLYEKASLLSGKDTFTTVPYEQYKIPSVFLSDGPHGLRKQAGASDHLGLNASLPSTCFPTAATMANSWDEQLGEAVGEHLGEEAVALGVGVVLGPGLNIKRSPLCGRNFEYFSEDPYLSGKMAAAYIRGIQSKGIAACPKHFAANSQELRRMSNDSIVDERTFREIYTTGFEIAVKEGKAKSIMTSYNRINGVYANENEHLLQDILVQEWGFEGMVVSDWGGSNDHVLGVKNGSHLEMPAPGKGSIKEIVKAVEAGDLSEALLNQRVDELLSVILEVHKTIANNQNQTFDEKAHHEFARKASRESIVLLKNEEQLLPLKAGSRVAIIGDFAETPRYQGAGSSVVNPTRLDGTLQEIKESGLILTAYEKGYERDQPADLQLIEQAKAAATAAEYVLVYAGLDEIIESEGMDRTHMKMSVAQNELIQAVAAVNNNTIVILSAGSAIEMPWLGKVRAVLHGYLSGQAGAGAMLDVITGNYCPSGKLNETYPLRLEDTPAYAYFPGKEKTAEYRESVYVGYRYYETAGVPVRFPFGYGLSYTTFDYSDYTVNGQGVSFTITNVGACDGAEIAQLYVGRKSDAVFRPLRELKGFVKVHLKAGEAKRVQINFDDKSFRYYNIDTNSWEIEDGQYEICIGINASQMVLTSELEVAGSSAGAPYIRENLQAYFSGNIKNVDDYQFESILGRPLPERKWSGALDINDAFCQMYYAKSLLARFIYKILTHIKESSEKKGKPNLNVLFIYNMPFRGLAKMTNGAVNMEMAEALLEIVNGRGLIGFGHLIRAFCRR